MNPRRTLPLAAFLFATGLGVAPAATVRAYQPEPFAAAQAADAPILLFIEAPWCPTCAKERPILADLYKAPEFDRLQVFTIDFDTSKALLRDLHVAMQSTLIAYHGAHETARATALTDPVAIKALLAASGS